MTTFTIEGFAQDCKKAMADADDRRVAAEQFLQQTLNNNALEDIKRVLEDAIPADADVGEMIVHASPELTMLYARAPGRFQSGIHNHTVFACIGQLSGCETSQLYQPDAAGKLQPGDKFSSKPGEVVSLAEDAIHHIENMLDELSCSLHIYGGDFHAIMDERSLWSYDDYTEMNFSFPGLIKESIKAMKLNHNQKGLDEIVKAIPSVKPLVDA